MKIKNLTINQKKFVKAYIQTGNGKEAVKKAYPNNHDEAPTASKLLKKPHIQQAIQEAFNRFDRDVDKEIGQLIKVADAKDMKDLPTYTDKLKANELLLKLRGAFNQPNMNLNLSFTGNIEDLPEGQAREILEKIRSKNTEVVQ